MKSQIHRKLISIIVVSLNTKKDFLDYSITQDMFQLSLQEKSLSCESSATSDIIASLYWKSIHENEIIQALPKSLYYQALPEKHPDGITIWGNPHIWFVGYINHSGDILAKQKLMTGYGVYEAPIAEVYKKIGLNTQILNRS